MVGVVDVAIDHFRISTPCHWQRANLSTRIHLKDKSNPKKPTNKTKKMSFLKKNIWKKCGPIVRQLGLCNMYPLDSPQLETWNAWMWICGRFVCRWNPSTLVEQNDLPFPEGPEIGPVDGLPSAVGFFWGYMPPHGYDGCTRWLGYIGMFLYTYIGNYMQLYWGTCGRLGY